MIAPVSSTSTSRADGDNMGPGFASLKQEVANPENRDGPAALLDDEAHEQAVREQTRNRQAPESDGK